MLNTQVVPGIQIRKIKLKRLRWCKEDQPVSLSTSTVENRFQLPTYKNVPVLKELKLPTLEIRRKIKRLCLFHKAFHHQIAINIPDYIKQQNRTTRQYHPQKFRNVQTSSNTYKYSFFPSSNHQGLE